MYYIFYINNSCLKLTGIIRFIYKRLKYYLKKNHNICPVKYFTLWHIYRKLIISKNTSHLTSIVMCLTSNLNSNAKRWVINKLLQKELPCQGLYLTITKASYEPLIKTNHQPDKSYCSCGNRRSFVGL